MTGIVLVTHNGLGESLRHQAEIILGRNLNMTLVSISEQADPDHSLAELIGAIAHVTDPDGVLILTDLPGATPHNLAVRAAAPHDLPVVSGLNLPMLLKAINHADKPAAELARLADLGGHQGIIHQ
ncbi:MAG: PTS fructose transporter subunit IIA [Wenzhouxiangella sp.]|jgi:mannose/fructose-specific phosphotransferase system component IIA|nr:PTS fructose transporter subunit IIA [Wenzhouxiangella sp.]